MPTRDQIKGCFLGIAIGDALGCPVETWSIERIAEKHGRVTDYFAPKGHKYLKANRPAGMTTDDWQLTAATAEAVLGAGGFDMETQVKYHLKALDESTDGWGKTTKENLKRFKRKKDTPAFNEPAPSEEKRGTGNGICMKIAPLALWSATIKQQDYTKWVAPYSRMTHNTRMAVASGAAMTAAYQSVLSTRPGSFDRTVFSDAVMRAVRWAESQDIPELGAGEYLNPDAEAGNENHAPQYHKLSVPLGFLERADEYDPLRLVEAFKGGCYVYESLPFSLMFFARNPETIETLFDVVSAGGDTDSNGSMVGGLLGSYHGTKIFPDRLIEGLFNKDEVLDLADRFASRYDWS